LRASAILVAVPFPGPVGRLRGEETDLADKAAAQVKGVRKVADLLSVKL
jgi:hypothetical protein